MTKQKILSFEAALQELTQIADKLDSQEINIDEGLRVFERGLWLAQQLQQKLSEADNKIKELKVKFRGTFSEYEEGREVE